MGRKAKLKQPASDGESRRPRSLQPRESHGLLLKMQKSALPAAAFWSIEPTVGVEIGISAAVVLDFPPLRPQEFGGKLPALSL